MGKRDSLWDNDVEGLRNSPAQRLPSLLVGEPQNFEISFLEAKNLILLNTCGLGRANT